MNRKIAQCQALGTLESAFRELALAFTEEEFEELVVKFELEPPDGISEFPEFIGSVRRKFGGEMV